MNIPKFRWYCLILSSILFTGCSTMNGLKTKLAQEQTKNLTTKLPNGTVLHFNTNVTPTRAWGCYSVGEPQVYNWAMIKFQSQFNFKGPLGVLAKKGIDYLTSNQLTANYINMQIPNTTSFAYSDSARETTYTNLSPSARVVLRFYQCQRINPQNQLGSFRHNKIGIGIGAGADNISPGM